MTLKISPLLFTICNDNYFKQEKIMQNKHKIQINKNESLNINFYGITSLRNNHSLEIKKYIEQNIIPIYKDFDKAHNIKHVNTVIENSLDLAKRFDVNKDMVYVIAAYHDLGLSKDRASHHIISGEILEKDECINKWFFKQEIKTMKEAIEDHRASSKTAPRTIYGKIVAEADRNIEPMDIIQRTLQFSLKHNPNQDMQFYYDEVYNHLIEKYSENGYITLWIKESKNGQNLSILRNIIKDENKLKNIFNEFYAQEINRDENFTTYKL